MDEVNGGKLNPQPQETEGISKQGKVIKYPFSNCGRPSIEEDPAIQDEYIAIYIDYTVGAFTEAQIALTRNISIAKVKKSVQWCRRLSDTYSREEDLIDYINVCNFRTQPLVVERDRIIKDIHTEIDNSKVWQEASEEKRRLLTKPDSRRTVRLVKLQLEYDRLIGEWLKTKVKCLLRLDSVRSREQECVPYQTKPNTYPEPMRMTEEDRKAIAEIFERAEQRKALSNG